MVRECSSTIFRYNSGSSKFIPDFPPNLFKVFNECFRAWPTNWGSFSKLRSYMPPSWRVKYNNWAILIFFSIIREKSWLLPSGHPYIPLGAFYVHHFFHIFQSMMELGFQQHFRETKIWDVIALKMYFNFKLLLYVHKKVSYSNVNVECLWNYFYLIQTLLCVINLSK